jgi:uncharacterized protein with HEPN domain
MSERVDSDLLADIREAARRIAEYLDGVTYEGFLADTKTQDSVIRNLEIVGEAARRVSDGLRNRTPGLPWKSMADMRNRLIHGYFGVDLDVVWQVVKDELPVVVDRLASGVEGKPTVT